MRCDVSPRVRVVSHYMVQNRLHLSDVMTVGSGDDDGRTLWATLLGENAVAEVDVTSFTVRRKFTGGLAQFNEAPRESPWRLLLIGMS